MQQMIACFSLSALLLTNVFADGYLWLSGAGGLPARIFRYNLRTGQVDRVVAPAGVRRGAICAERRPQRACAGRASV